MAEEQQKEEVSKISRREFLKDAGLVVGGATIGSMALMNACGNTTTETVTKTVAGTTTTKTVTAAGGTTTVTSPPVTVIQTTDATKTIKITVNSSVYEVKVEPQETVHEMMRNKLGFMSLKEMCSGYGACGSCSVIMDGRPVLTCMALASECDGAVIETAEGIADANHPLVNAYVLNHCMQCGYCTPGFLVTAKALLDHKPDATEEDIREALGGNICRCGTYPAHINAVLSVV